MALFTRSVLIIPNLVTQIIRIPLNVISHLQNLFPILRKLRIRTVIGNAVFKYESLFTHSVSHVELQKTAEVLCFIHNNHIHSLEDMRACLAAANRKEDNAMYRYFKLADKKNS